MPSLLQSTSQTAEVNWVPLRGANLESQQLYVYVCNISTKLDQALDHRNTDAINSYCRALHSGLV
jgi:hypothetical protein